ncbi:MAG: hypothetical protein ACJ76S_02420 [Solirubrobacteraceae bacterium]
MLGRRVLLLVAILVLSGFVTAVLAPPGVRRRLGSATTTGPAAPPSHRASPGPTGGRIVRASVHVNPRHPPVVRARVGDLIELSVVLGRPSTVALGDERIESGDEDTPARFDFIADQTGTYGMRRLDDGATVARLVVSRGA